MKRTRIVMAGLLLAITHPSWSAGEIGFGTGQNMDPKEAIAKARTLAVAKVEGSVAVDGLQARNAPVKPLEVHACAPNQETGPLFLACQGSPMSSHCRESGETCSSSRDCCGAMVCTKEVCSNPSSRCNDSGQGCHSSNDCCGDMVCDDGVCSNPRNRCNDSGQRCSSSSDCCGAMVCTQGRCSNPSNRCNERGQGCNRDNDCCGSLVCASNRCSTSR